MWKTKKQNPEGEIYPNRPHLPHRKYATDHIALRTDTARTRRSRRPINLFCARDVRVRRGRVTWSDARTNVYKCNTEAGKGIGVERRGEGLRVIYVADRLILFNKLTVRTSRVATSVCDDNGRARQRENAYKGSGVPSSLFIPRGRRTFVTGFAET